MGCGLTAFLLACSMMRVGDPHGVVEEVCCAIEHFSESQGFEAETLAAMAWHESRLYPSAVNSRSGARGVLQVILGKRWSPKYTNEEMLDPWLSVEVGVLMAVRWRDKEPVRWIECYSSGTRCRNGSYIRAVSRTAQSLRVQRRKHERELSGDWRSVEDGNH